MRWPEPGSDLPPSAIRTLDPEKDARHLLRLLPGRRPPRGALHRTKDETETATRSTPSGSWRSRCRDGERDDWPEQLFLLGDQVYVDEGSPKTRKKIKKRRGTETPPFDEVTDFEEYTWLYRESWEEPLIRWLFSASRSRCSGTTTT